MATAALTRAARTSGRWPSARLRDAATSVSVETWGVLLALVLGGGVRAMHVGTDSFPLNDGGLFLVMIEEIVRGGFALPAFTSYNGAGIPFAYPPLGLYLAALVSVLTGAEPTTVLARLPLVVSVATIPVVYALVRALTLGRPEAALASLFFACMPAPFTWLIMGGGITRAPGHFFSLAAVAVLLVAFRSGRARTAAAGGLLFGLGALSHPQMAWYAAVMLACAFVGRVRTRAAWRSGLVAGAVALVVVTPWLVTVLGRHGPAPLVGAFATNGFADTRRDVTAGRVWGEQFEPVVGPPIWDWYGGPLPMALGLAGVGVALRRRKLLAVAWLLALPVAGARAGPLAFALPLACMCGLAVGALPRLTSRGMPAGRGAYLGTLLAAAITVVVLGAELRVALADPYGILGHLTHDERATMGWIARETPPDSRFLVFQPHGNDGWWSDRVVEWFPVLAERASAATPQGREWLGDFRRTIRKYEQLQNCADATVTCLEGWEKRFDERHTHVYVPKGAPPRVSSGRSTPATATS